MSVDPPRRRRRGARPSSAPHSCHGAAVTLVQASGRGRAGPGRAVSRARRLPGPHAADRGPRRRPAGPDDPGREGRPDDPGRADRRGRGPVADRDVPPRQRAVRRRLGARGQHARRAGPTWSTRFQEAALGDRLGIPLLYGVDAVHGHANLLGATVFPHNIGLGRDPRPAAAGEDRPHHRRGDPRVRAELELRALHLRGPRGPVGPDLRVVRRVAGAGPAAGDRDRRPPGSRPASWTGRTGSWPRPSTTPATG